jgi:hypothetical protein
MLDDVPLQDFDEWLDTLSDEDHSHVHWLLTIVAEDLGIRINEHSLAPHHSFNFSPHITPSFALN